ncbi:hypothetical protein [Bradyrhizobium sp. NAS80.1]|uniref:hypothetical protein n=1 Tax=Bradyrhizobium sp. NAS80.1 TaxID=1680159 RepID=UPI00143D08A0|nr:hypothetical protein [Bradyrhizobium sp. NAS80.1]
MEGDTSLLDRRLSAGHATVEEQKLAADLLMGRIKPRKKRMDELLAEDRRQLVAEYVLKGERENPGTKREALIARAMEHFDVPRSEVQTSLKNYRRK